MESKIKIIIAGVLAFAIILAAVAVASAAYAVSRPSGYPAGSNGNYAPYSGYGEQGSYGSAPYRGGYGMDIIHQDMATQVKEA